MSILFSALSEVQFDLKGHGTVPILQLLVDRVPYNEFQLFRGPYACKLSEGRYRPDSKLEPEGFFYNDPLTGFASYVNQDYHLHRPSPSQLLEWNDTVRQCWQQHARHAERTLSDSGWVGSRTSICLQDLSNLYLPIFEQHTTGTMCLFTLSDLEKYELALRFLHPDRASQWWSWFRISGVTYKLLQRYASDDRCSKRIWDAHFAWSSKYPNFDREENISMVERNRGKERVSGLSLLLRVMKHDNPGMDFNDVGIWTSLRSRLSSTTTYNFV